MSAYVNETAGDAIPPILNWLADAVLPPFLVATILAVPSVILYLLEVALIVHFRHSQLSSSFFKLFIARGIANLAGLVGQILNQRLGMFGLLLPLYLQLPRLCLTFIYFLTLYPVHVENLATAMLLFNRLTAIALPLKYEQLWKRVLPWTIALIFLWPLPITWQIFTLSEFVHIHVGGEENNTLTYTLDHGPRPEGQWDDSMVCAVSIVFFTLVGLGLNLGCLLAYRQGRRRLATTGNVVGTETGGEQQQLQQRKVETRLTVYTLLIFLSQMLSSIYGFLLVYAMRTSRTQLDQAIFLAVYNQLVWVSDICSIVCPAWLLLWASSQMRQQMLTLIRAMPLAGFFKRAQNSSSPSRRMAWSGQAAATPRNQSQNRNK